MRDRSERRLLGALFPLALLAFASAYYVPGTYPAEFKVGEPLQVHVSTLTSFDTELPYEYYTMPFCKPAEGVHRIANAANPGTILEGIRIENSPYNFSMKVKQTGLKACPKGSYGPLTGHEVKTLQRLIDQHYRVNLILDNLPVTVYDLLDEKNEFLRPGFELGFKRDGKYYIHNHLVFNVLVYMTHGEYTAARDSYAKSLTVDSLDTRHHRHLLRNPHQNSRALLGGDSEAASAAATATASAEGADGTAAASTAEAGNPPYYMVVGFEVSPCSIARKAGAEIEDIVCGVDDNSHITPQEIKEGANIVYTYDVYWQDSKIKWASRWDAYLRMPGGKADLATYTTQLERARADASSLTAKVLEREQALASCEHQLELERGSLGAQLRAAEDKLAVKAQQLAALEDELQSREQELRTTRAQLQVAQRSLLTLQAEGEAHLESANTTAADLAASQQQVEALQAELWELRHQSANARTEAQQLTEQMLPLQEQLGRSEGQVAQLLVVVRGALAAGAASAHQQLQTSAGGTLADFPEASFGGAPAAAPGPLPTSLRLLEELTSVLVEELQRRGAVMGRLEGEVAGLQGQLTAREEDVRRLEARLKSAQDGLAARLDDVSRLQTALRRKEADCEAVETEISAQIADYQRLKQRLLQQERDSSRLSADQEALLRRCDELEGALAAKQEECALLNKKCAQLEEQWQAG
ncbi:hypothetical protein Agub_g7977, partial [Astrephomene gubernaculifera]